MKLLKIFTVLSVFLVASCAEEELKEVAIDQSTPLTQSEIEQKQVDHQFHPDFGQYAQTIPGRALTLEDRK